MFLLLFIVYAGTALWSLSLYAACFHMKQSKNMILIVVKFTLRCMLWFPIAYRHERESTPKESENLIFVGCKKRKKTIYMWNRQMFRSRAYWNSHSPSTFPLPSSSSCCISRYTMCARVQKFHPIAAFSRHFFFCVWVKILINYLKIKFHNILCIF